MKAKISALMDGELDTRELSAPMSALGTDREAVETWRTYHLISDALQGRTLLANECLRRVVARLAEEPALIGPLPTDVVRPERSRWFVPSALAASVAAVALVGWMAFLPRQDTGSLAPMAGPPQPAQVAKTPTRLPMTAATRDYLIAHQVFSPRNSLQGMAPYVRSVAAESHPGKP
jgi:sigma-E factor negative regulatory protein RseA